MTVARRSFLDRRSSYVVSRLIVAALIAATVSCGPPRKPQLRQSTKSYMFTIAPEPSPPYAREDVIYTITVRDRESGQPIETGEGRIFGNTLEMAREGKSVYDGFVKSPQVGTYTAKMNFLTSGQWAIGIQFHSDSAKPLEKTEWMQDVLPDRSKVP